MVTAKKHLGQHFLNDINIAKNIVGALSDSNIDTLEIGPGTGVLTGILLEKNFPLKVIEIDRESVAYLREKYPDLTIFSHDFLRFPIEEMFTGPFRIIGNFPYNISSQILFRTLEYRQQIPELVGMFQKEVAERIATGPGSKRYGILSVLCQAFYDVEYLFTVSEDVFTPPPKVKSGVLRFTRKENFTLPCDEVLFFKIVKAGFNQRRKMLRNAVRSFNIIESEEIDLLLTKRAEQLSVEQFVTLTNAVRTTPLV